MVVNDLTNHFNDLINQSILGKKQTKSNNSNKSLWSYRS